MNKNILGCQYHPGCCVPDDKIPNAHELRERWNRKMRFMSSNGVPIIMKECQWKPRDYDVRTRMPRILCQDNEESLLTAIRAKEVFGFVVCDISTPIEMQKQYLNGHLFPPVIDRMTVEARHLSPYMKQRFLQQSKKAKRSTVVQVS